MNDEILNGSETERKWQLPFKFLTARRLGFVLLVALLLATMSFFGMRAVAKPEKSSKSDAKKQQLTPVTVATAIQKTVPVQLQAIGNVQANSTVQITPQVGGQITGVYFKKGQEVEKGQLLFTLDSQTENAAIQQARGTLAKDLAQVQQARATLAKDLTQVQQARATLAKDKAQEQYAQAQDSRYGALYKDGAISLDSAQQYTTNKRVYVATVQADKDAIANAEALVEVDRAAIQNAEGVVSADEGALKNAEVQLSYTKIYAPISGRAGNILVTPGNVVQANSTNPLVTIVQIHPIQVAFAVPEASLPVVQKYKKNGKLTVDVTFPNGNARPSKGDLTFVNNTVDNTSGTIQLIGDFENPRGDLWPGQFVNTTLTLTEETNATVVPSQAVQNGPNGQFVFAVKPDMTVQNVPVTIGSTFNGLAVVQKGLQPGDKVVTDGQANLISGSKIRIKSASNSVGNNS